MQKAGYARILCGIAAFDVLYLPAGREIRLAPGGTHLMLAGLKHPLRAGAAPWRLVSPGPAYIANAVLHCTAGDVLIGAGALFAALIATRAGALRQWRWTRVGVVAVGFGLAYTAFSEWMNTAIRASWAYSEWMPVLPFVQIGLSPLLQWVLVPAAALAFSRRLALPRQARRAVNRELGDRS